MVRSLDTFSNTRGKPGFLGVWATGDGPLIPIRGFRGRAKVVLYSLEDGFIDPGESLAVTLHNVEDDDEATAAGNQVAAFTVIPGKNDGEKASGTVQFTDNPANGEILDLGTASWTFVTSGATGNQTNIQGSLVATLAQLQSDLAGSADAEIAKSDYAEDGVDTLTVTFKQFGVIGNAHALAFDGDATVSGSGTLEGGVDQTAYGADFEEIAVDMDNLDPAKPYLQAKIVKSSSYAGVGAVIPILGGYGESPIPAAA